MATLNTKDQEILKDITAGKYRDYYFVYDRRSTDEPDNQKNSLSYQKIENLKFAHDKKLLIAPITIVGFCTDGIISEKHSGFKEDGNFTITPDGKVQYSISRIKFHRMVYFLNKKLLKGVIFLCYDRASRNSGDDAIINKLIANGVDLRFAQTNYEKNSSGFLHRSVDSMFSGHYSRVVGEKVKLAQEKLRNEGVCVYKAPVGYLNTGKAEYKPIDSVRGPIITELFELYSTGEWSLADLARWANKAGLTTSPSRHRRTPEEMAEDDDEETGDKRDSEIPVSRPIIPQSIHGILSNRFYLGLIRGRDGQYLKSTSHKALVTEELFNKVQMVLRGKNISAHYLNKLPLANRGFVRCGGCRRVYTPYEQKGITFFRSNCQRGCENKKKNFNLSFLEEKVSGLMAKLSFTDDELSEIDAEFNDKIISADEKKKEKLRQNDRIKRKLQEDLEYIRSNKISLLRSKVFSPESLATEEGRLHTEFLSCLVIEK